MCQKTSEQLEGMVTITVTPFYEISRITSINQLKSIFPAGLADPRNWCVFSTSGVHGSYTKLDEIENSIRNNLNESHPDYCPPELTCLVIKPRTVVMQYGEIEIKIDDIPFLRSLVRSSLQMIAKSQEGNFRS